MKMNEIIDQFIAYCEKECGYSPHTLQAYNTALLQFWEYLVSSKLLADMDEEYVEGVHKYEEWQALITRDIRPYMGWLHDEKHLKRNSIRQKTVALKSFFKYCFDNELVESNIAANVITPKKAHDLPHFILQKEVELWLDNMPVNSFCTARNKLLFELLYSSGLRISEALALELKDINKSANHLKVLGKGRKERVVPVGDIALKYLEIYLFYRREIISESNRLFVTNEGKNLSASLAWKITQKSMQKDVNCDKKSPHVLRHSFATHLLDNGATLSAVSEMLGHSSLSTTEIYTHISRDQLKRAYKQGHPKA